MTNLSKNQKGFTVVELVIVIIVIVGLGYLVVSNYSAIQAKQRDATRQNDLKAMQQQIEAYFSQNGFYPNLNDLNSPSWRATNMKKLNSSDLVDPSSKCNPSTSPCLGGNPDPVKKQYEYYATQSDGTTSCNGKVGGNSDQECADYKLIAAYEGVVNGVRSEVLPNRN